MTHYGKLYLSNKMTGIPYFNAPWFDLVTAQLRDIIGVTGVFNPAEEDRKMGLDPMLCPTGSPEEADAAGFQSLRKTLKADLDWIADEADGLVIGPHWADSSGALAEIGLAHAIHIPVWESSVFFYWVAKDKGQRLFDADMQLPKLKELLNG